MYIDESIISVCGLGSSI